MRSQSVRECRTTLLGAYLSEGKGISQHRDRERIRITGLAHSKSSGHKYDAVNMARLLGESLYMYVYVSLMVRNWRVSCCLSLWCPTRYLRFRIMQHDYTYIGRYVIVSSGSACGAANSSCCRL